MSLKDKLKRTVVTSSTIREEKKKEVPKGAKIIDQSIRTETEEIENGYLISKSYDITYEEGSGEGSGENKNRGYAYFTKKWFTKDDPLTITLNDKSLAEAFEEDED